VDRIFMGLSLELHYQLKLDWATQAMAGQRKDKRAQEL